MCKASDYPESSARLSIQQPVPIVFVLLWYGRMDKITTIASSITDIMLYMIKYIIIIIIIHNQWIWSLILIRWCGRSFIFIYSNEHVSIITIKLILTYVEILRMLIYKLFTEWMTSLKTRHMNIFLYCNVMNWRIAAYKMFHIHQRISRLQCI